MTNRNIKISHPENVLIEEVETKGNSQLEKGSLTHFSNDSPTMDIIVIKLVLKENSAFNVIEFEPVREEMEFLPEIFRFEISKDGLIWEPIIQEHNYSSPNKGVCRWNFSLLETNFFKLVIKPTKRNQAGDYKISFKNFRLGISGIENILASSENDRFWVKENLIDKRTDYGWSSKEKKQPSEEYVLFDLGSVNRVEEFRLLSKEESETNFPEHFVVYYSEDDLSWYQLLEEPHFLSEPSTWYTWKFIATNMRFIKIVCFCDTPNSKGIFVSQIVEFEVFASSDSVDLSIKRNIIEPPPYSSIIRAGLVRLAGNGESREGVAVQGNDKRLMDATVEFKGIVELASDGESREGVVVQGNDRRLKNATENSYGLVKLARNRESKEGVAVQGNDERLRNASTEYHGIVELAEDGETRPGVVVQGNDSRLKKATTKEYGLTIMSELGNEQPGTVVTADDPRIKKATTTKEGILRFANNGEEEAWCAVQGNDKRLKEASTENLGIVKLAHSGETSEGKAVQGNDKRLKYATENESGIVSFARHDSNVGNQAVQANDPRLYDKREAKPHTHDYAPKVHDYDSHTGLIRLKGETPSTYKHIVAPPQNHGVIYGKNESKTGAALVGVGENEGIVGFSNEYGVIGYSGSSEQESAGICGFAKKGHGGEFTSQSSFALCANGIGNNKKDISGSGKAFLALGDSDFRGTVKIDDDKGFHCIAVCFSLLQNEIVSEGDVIVIAEKGGKIAKSKSAYSTKVMGVAVSESTVLLGRNKSKSEDVLVALYGLVKINVDASDGPIQYGDILVTGLTSGHAIKAETNRLKPGMIIAKALGECKKDRSIIPAVLAIH